MIGAFHLVDNRLTSDYPKWARFNSLPRGYGWIRRELDKRIRVSHRHERCQPDFGRRRTAHSGFRMKCRTLGRGPVVVKLAGIAGGVGLYDEEMGAAARGGFLVAALDTGGDRRDDPAPGPLTWDFLAEEVFRGLDSLGAPRAVLWGTSFGCLVALAAATRKPERVTGLLLCHPPNPALRPRYEAALLRWTETRRDPVFAATAAFTLGFNALIGWEAVFPTTLARMPALARASAEAATPARTLREKLRLLIKEPAELPAPGSCPPAVIVASLCDTVTPLRGARRLAARLSGSRMRVIRLAGHCAAYSRPRAYARIVTEELRALHPHSGK